jgi:N-acetylglucosamine-6-phosphate deacetylase
MIGQGYVDLQVNGYVGVDFNDPQITQERLLAAARAMRDEGVAAAFPTVITARLDRMIQCLGNLAEAISSNIEIADIFHGIHIEGPFLNRQPGFIGAHPPDQALPSSPDHLKQLLDASQGFAKLITLAPEIDSDGALTRLCLQRGCSVAAGHTDASLDDLKRCIDSGLTLFTHLGNGCPKLLDRHDNIIYRALRLADKLSFTLIADSFHVPKLLMQNFLDWVDPCRLAIVSDAISAAGLGPGIFRLGHRTVNVGADKAVRDPGGQHFVGAASTMRDADQWLCCELGLGLPLRRQLLVDNPCRFVRIGASK